MSIVHLIFFAFFPGAGVEAGGQLCFEAVEVHAGFAEAVEMSANIAEDVQVSVIGAEATQVACT